jgi:hypothetical protein
MNSFLFPSHRLFVAAASEDRGRQTKRARPARAVNLSAAAKVIPLEYTDCAPPPRSVQAEPLRETGARPGW